MADPDPTPDLTCTTPQLVEMLDVSAQYLGRLMKEGTIPKPISRGKWDVVATVRAYAKHLAAKGAKTEQHLAEDFALTVAKRQRTQYMTQMAQLELAERQGDVGSLGAMTLALSEALTKLTGRLNAVGSIVAPQLELASTTTERQRIIDAAIGEALDELGSDARRYLGRPAGAGPGPHGSGGSYGSGPSRAHPDDGEPVG